MGACPSTCEIRCGSDLRYQGSVFELNLEPMNIQRKCSYNSGNEATVAQSSNKKMEQYQDSLLQASSLIKDELVSSNLDNNPIPEFITGKIFHHTVIKKRENRFLQDLEIEVKARIREIQLEEERTIQEYIQRQQMLQKQQEEESIRRIRQEEQHSEGYKHQINKKQAKLALQKLLSNYYMEDDSQPKKIKKKGILKKCQSMRHFRSYSSKSQKSSVSHNKRTVHFSEDTNFKNERRTETIKNKWWRLF